MVAFLLLSVFSRLVLRVVLSTSLAERALVHRSGQVLLHWQISRRESALVSSMMQSTVLVGVTPTRRPSTISPLETIPFNCQTQKVTPWSSRVMLLLRGGTRLQVGAHQ